MRTRTFYDPEFKRQAIELAKTSDKPISQIARDLGLQANTLYN
jgi:transposase-like protein